MAISMFKCNLHKEATTKITYFRNFCEQHNQRKKFRFIQPQSWQSSAFHGFVTVYCRACRFSFPDFHHNWSASMPHYLHENLHAQIIGCNVWRWFDNWNIFSANRCMQKMELITVSYNYIILTFENRCTPRRTLGKTPFLNDAIIRLHQ